MAEYYSEVIPDYAERQALAVGLQAAKYLQARDRAGRALFENRGPKKVRAILPRAIEIVRGHRLAKELEVDYIDQAHLDFILPKIAQYRTGESFIEPVQSPYED